MALRPENRPAGGLIWGLQRRLLMLLFLPLGLVGLFSVFFNYQGAGTAALQQDQKLLRLVPLLADSVVVVQPGESVEPAGLGEEPGVALLLAPQVDEFLKARDGFADYGLLDANGRLLLGARWLPTVLPTTDSAEFLSVVEGGITYRVVAQRSPTAAGELILMLADGSDPRQHWLDTVLLRLLLPNVLLMLVAAIGVTWAVARALRPLIDLREAVEHRSPRDLSPIDEHSAPTEVRPLVVALNRLFSLVNDQSQAQRRFVADAAHQLRTPLAGLQAQVEAWAQAAKALGPSDPMGLRVEQVLRLRDATRRTSQLANQLLALSRADSVGADNHPMEQVDLQALCENILAMYLDAAAEKQMDLGIESAPAQTRGSAWLLRELLINLVDNAVRYTQPGGRITLRCGQVEAAGEVPLAWIEVEDDGPGIAREERARVLQRFYRLQGTQADGSGLGLAIADEIARAHRTQLQLLDGAAGRGLRVRLAFAGVAAVHV